MFSYSLLSYKLLAYLLVPYLLANLPLCFFAYLLSCFCFSLLPWLFAYALLVAYFIGFFLHDCLLPFQVACPSLKIRGYVLPCLSVCFPVLVVSLLASCYIACFLFFIFESIFPTFLACFLALALASLLVCLLYSIELTKDPSVYYLLHALPRPISIHLLDYILVSLPSHQLQC